MFFFEGLKLGLTEVLYAAQPCVRIAHGHEEDGTYIVGMLSLTLLSHYVDTAFQIPHENHNR